jgi:hypothetical protein
MQATAATTLQNRDPSEQARMRALVRFNPLTFHSLAAASFLETAVPAQVNRIARLFAAYPDVRLWLEQTWWPQRAELGRALRGYVEATWPEFDWHAAYQEFYGTYDPRSGLQSGRGHAALEALALCVTAAQAALFYRAWAACAEEPGLRALARRAANEHAAYFDFFRALFERCKRSRRVGVIAAWRAVTATCRSVRDVDVPAAFQPLERNWSGAAIAPVLTYPEYQSKMAHLVQRHATVGPALRLLFRPWLKRAALARVTPPPSRLRGGLRMVPQTA